MTTTERLYLNSWEYNAALIISELAKIIKKNGGRIAPYYRNTMISNRSIKHEMIKLELHIEKLKKLQKQNYKIERENMIKNLSQKIIELQTYENENKPILLETPLTYIRFILNDNMYYYQLDDNPFFDFIYNKTPVKNNQYSLDACCEIDNKEWLYDCYLSYKCTDEERKEAAKYIFNMLVSAKPSYIKHDTQKIRVSNSYNNGYHYEIVQEKERMQTIDF